jgi:hypothetical protein
MEEELQLEEEWIKYLDNPTADPSFFKTTSALDRAFGYVWEDKLESRIWNIPVGGTLGTTSEFYESGLPDAVRTRHRYNVRLALAVGVPEGPWWPTAQVHENSGYWVGTGGSTDAGLGNWDAVDGARGGQFADPPQTRFDLPLMAMTTLPATWPSTGWPAPETVVETWLGAVTWNEWARTEAAESYGEFDDEDADRRGLGESTSLNLSGRVRLLQHGTLLATFYQWEVTNNSSFTYNDVYIGHFQRRRLFVSDGNELFPRWDPDRIMWYPVGTNYFTPLFGAGSHWATRLIPPRPS